MNNFNGVGNLTRDPESKVSESGVEMSKFYLAISRPKNQSGESQADFIPCRAIGKLALICSQYLRKGRKCAVTGKVQTYMFTTPDGSKRSGFEVLVSEMTLLPSSNPNVTNLGDVHSDLYAPAHHDVGADKTNAFPIVDDDDLPF